MPRLKRGAVIFQRDFDDATNVRPVDADALLRACSSARCKRSCSSFKRATRRSASSPSSRSATFTRSEVASCNSRRQLGDFVAPNAVCGLEFPPFAHAEHFPGCAELPPDHLCLPNERVQHAVLFALVVEEVGAGHDLRRLQFAIDPSVALFEARRVPGQVDVDKIVATGLKVQAFARGVCADEDAHRLAVKWRVEGDLDSIALNRDSFGP